MISKLMGTYVTDNIHKNDGIQKRTENLTKSGGTTLEFYQ